MRDIHDISLSCLNDDCIQLVMTELRVVNPFVGWRTTAPSSLQQFSTVARRYRQLALPILFFHCRAPLNHPNNSFIPETLWSYVRSIVFTGYFEERDFYGKYPSEEFLLKVMPQLTALEVVRFVNLMNGLPSYFVEAMILAPQLIAIHVSDHCRWPRTYWQSLEESPVISSHMKEFTWVRSIWSDVDDNHLRTEREFFLSFIPRMRPTLQMLKVPLESMCYQALLTSPWPCLSELSIIAQNPPAHLTAHVDFAPLFFNIPSLQIFTILVPQCAYLSRIPLLLPSASNSYPALDSLRSLTISFPDPKDIIFDRLPESLHHLSLTDWPRHYLHVDECAIVRSLGWTSPILTSSELHDILRRCRCPALESLEVVYKEDNSDGDVLLHMAHVFPALRTLKIFRYRSSSHDPVDVKAIRRSLSHLTELRTLYIHIDMDGASMPIYWEERKARIRGMEYRASLGDLAQALVEGLAPNLEQIYMLERWPVRGTSNWTPWEIIREAGEAEVRTICRKVDGQDLPEQEDKLY